MARCYRDAHANPASQHRLGQRARRLLEETREGIAGILGAETSGRTPDRILLTSGGTEANNLAILGIAQARNPAGAGRLIVSAIEHPSVLEPAEHLMEHGWQLDCLGADSLGVVQPERLRPLLNHKTALVSVMLANHDTGVLQPVAELAHICQEVDVPLHTDAVQVAGKLLVHFRQLGAAAMTVAAHKFGGPLGIGALVLRNDVRVQALLHGGAQQWNMRPGTESLALAIGMFTALQLWQKEHEELAQRMTALRIHFERALSDRLETVVVHGHVAPRVPQTSNVAFLGLDGQVLLMALDMADIACSVGAACSSGSSEPSPTLRAMGLPAAVVNSSLRFSLGATTTKTQIDEAVRRIVQVVQQLRS